jgi:hypothetical protein
VMAISFMLVTAFVVFWILKRAKLRRAQLADDCRNSRID